MKHHESLRLVDWRAKILVLFVDIKNSSPLLTVIADILGGLDTRLESLEDSIKHWYECGEGKHINESIATEISLINAVDLKYGAMNGIVDFKSNIQQWYANLYNGSDKVEDVGEGTGNDGFDLFKLKPEDVTREIAEWLIANPVNVFVTQHPYLTQSLTGVNVLELLYAGGFVMDGDGVYHARQEWSLQSFEYSGYNDFYDTVFHYATDMNKAKFEFSDDDGNDYILWAWKGNYLNLGAGAEMGIYKRMEVLGAQTDHWLVDQSLAMPMTLTLDYNGKQIISYDPKKVDSQIFDPLRKSTDKWWVTGFNPDYQDVEAGELTVTYTTTFNTQAMYDDFYNKYGQGRDKDNRWTFDPKTLTATFKF